MLDRKAFGRLFAAQPRLAALLFVTGQVDRVLLTDRLTSLGRSAARARVAALLLWIAGRIAAADPQAGDSFVVPMTQEEIGDATGLTAVHVNRTMRVLGEQGLIARTGGTVRILDRARLAAVADHVEREERLDPGWLPSSS